MLGFALILSGPSGSGKSTLIRELVEDIGPYYFSISTTTRLPRVGEENGIDYYFVEKTLFEEDIAQGYFLEHAKVHDNYYGTSLRPVLEALEQGKLVIFDVDVQGHESIKKRLGTIATSVFVATPSFEVLEERLYARQTDTNEVIQKRLNMAVTEMERIDEFDYIIINDALDTAIAQLKAVGIAAKLKKDAQSIASFKAVWKGK